MPLRIEGARHWLAFSKLAQPRKAGAELMAEISLRERRTSRQDVAPRAWPGIRAGSSPHMRRAETLPSEPAEVEAKASTSRHPGGPHRDARNRHPGKADPLRRRAPPPPRPGSTAARWSAHTPPRTTSISAPVPDPSDASPPSTPPRRSKTGQIIWYMGRTYPVLPTFTKFGSVAFSRNRRQSPVVLKKRESGLRESGVRTNRAVDDTRA